MTSKSKRPTKFDSRNVTFVNYKFDRATKAQFDNWFKEHGDTVVKAVFETLQSEHKLGLSYDADNECFIASMTGKEDSLNPGVCLTIRSAEWFRAIAACAFVHTVVYSGEVWDGADSTDMV